MDAVPVLDASTLHGPKRAGFVAQLGEAFKRFGFVSLTGHEITPALTAPAYDAIRRFFALPEPIKRKYILAGTGGARGFTPFGIETAKDQSDPDLKEFFHVGRELPRDNPYGMQENLWPSEVPELRSTTLVLWRALEALGAQLLEACALFLGLDAHWFERNIDHGNSILRPLHYPPLSENLRGVRSAAHEDINLITLLIGSGEPGLEILRRDGSWLAIAPNADHVVVNVGDMLQRLTNHALVSTTHRVVNPGPPWHVRSRYSIPFFLHPNPEFSIETLPSCISSEQPDRYPEPITADAFLKQRLREIGLF